jgi:endonuclease/exonuclease/phosphatase family metal-dependent hydrolase
MSPTPTGATLRVLTVNIHKGYTALTRRFMLHELRDAVRAVGSDLVMLQEVRRAHNAPDHGLTRDQAEFLADRVWHDHAYARNAVLPNGDHGNALLSRWPIVSVDNHDVSLPGDEPRGLLHCVLELPGRVLHAVCVHLGLRESHRARQLAQLHSLVQRLPAEAPLIVAGDFNDWRARADGHLRGTGLQDVHRAALGRCQRSFPARCPLLPLDRIYVRRVAAHWPLPLPRRPWSRLSDHAPLGAEIQLT